MAVLPASAMNSRRLMASPRAEDHIGYKEGYHIFGSRIVPLVTPSGATPHIRFGLKADKSGYSITSSAIDIMPAGMVRPSALAVVMLMTKSNLFDCSTGSSVGLAPLRMLPV
jgi:hypothetical protein